MSSQFSSQRASRASLRPRSGTFASRGLREKQRVLPAIVQPGEMSGNERAAGFGFEGGFAVDRRASRSQLLGVGVIVHLEVGEEAGDVQSLGGCRARTRLNALQRADLLVVQCRLAPERAVRKRGGSKRDCQRLCKRINFLVGVGRKPSSPDTSTNFPLTVILVGWLLTDRAAPALTRLWTVRYCV